MSDVDTGVGPSLSAEEDAYFASGGESPISDTGSDDAGSVTSTGGDNPDGGNKSADQGNKPNDNKAPQHVPLAALQEERGKRKALGDTVKALETQLAELRGKFSVIDRLGKPEGDPEQPKGPPSPEEDIFGNVKHVGETVEQLKKRLDDQEAAAKTATEQQTFVRNYQNDAAQFEAKTPDYRAAYNHLLQSRASELLSIGYDDPRALQAAGATPQEVNAAAKALHDAIVADEYAIADLAFKKNKSPAEIIYGLAKQRGYAKAAAKPADDPEAQAAAERLATIERGQAANKSLNNAGSPAGDQEMTAERLDKMSMDEFEAWVTRNPAKARRIMGG